MKRAWVFVALVMGLMVVAATYAAWTESLNANGAVATGELDVEFAGYSVQDNDDSTGLAGTADTTVTLKDNDGDGDSDVAEISINNAYPGYESVTTLEIRNNGQIAAKVTSVSVNNPNPANVTVTVKLYDTDGNEITLPYTIDVSEAIYAEITAKVTDDAEEDSSYSFDVTFDFTQFNK